MGQGWPGRSVSGRELPAGTGGLDRQLRQIAAIFYLVASAIALLVNNSPLGQGYNRTAINLLTPLALVLTLAVWYLPWERYPRSLFALNTLGSLLPGALLVAWSGGWGSPFTIYYVFPVVFAALYYERRLAVLIALASALTSLAPLLFGFAPPDGIHTVVRLLLVAGATYLVIVYVVSAMVGEIIRLHGENRARQVVEEQLTYRAFHDPLTGLPNRALFTERFARALTPADRQPGLVALLFLDLDHLKAVNDTLGHGIGDQLLVAVAARLRACLQPEDTIARFGGDEFVILLEGLTDQGDATRAAERTMAALRPPFLLAGHEVIATASIGVALRAADDACADDLLREADTAMYWAKRAGKAAYANFDPSMATPVTRPDGGGGVQAWRARVAG